MTDFTVNNNILINLDSHETSNDDCIFRCFGSKGIKGNTYLKGTYFGSQSSLTPTANSFTVQNSTQDTLAYFNSSGSLFLLGTITTSSDLSGRTNTNLEFRNASGNLVSFFDNQGNLKLKGGIAENYDSP